LPNGLGVGHHPQAILVLANTCDAVGTSKRLENVLATDRHELKIERNERDGNKFWQYFAMIIFKEITV
jgi:hypothetical protein